MKRKASADGYFSVNNAKDIIDKIMSEKVNH